MENKKCDLCKREVGRYVEEITPIEFDGNKFDVCDICRAYLEADGKWQDTE